jgi:uncharacterized protein (TIGR02679 family)
MNRNDRLCSPRCRQLRDTFASPAQQAIFLRCKERLERAGDRPVRSVRLRGLDAAQRRAVADLFGWPRLAGQTVTLNLEKLDAVLRESRLRCSLREVVEALFGPIEDRYQQKKSRAAARAEMWRCAFLHPAVQRNAKLEAWLETLRKKGILLRAAQAATQPPAALLEAALETVSRLPAAGCVLSVLAADITGDAHALDDGKPLAGLVLRAAAALTQRAEVPRSAAARRQLWARVGVICDPLSCQVLVAGLRPRGDCVLARHLREAADAGHPRRITLRELVEQPPGLGGLDDPMVCVCENPGVVAAAADRLGARCRPLVCSEGIAAEACFQLLEGLAGSGADIRFHADFDPAGIRIGNLLYRRLDCRPWRFETKDYLQAVRRIWKQHDSTAAPRPAAPGTAAPGVDGAGVAQAEGAEAEAEAEAEADAEAEAEAEADADRVVRAESAGFAAAAARTPALWDAELAPTLKRQGRPVYEEQVLEELLADLVAT